MPCIEINNGILCIPNADFNCPTCEKAYSDNDGKYLDRCNSNKNNCTRIKCECGESFFVTYDYKSNVVSFLK